MHNRSRTVQPYSLTLSETVALLGDLELRYSQQIRQARLRSDPLLVLRLDPNDPLSDLARSFEQRVFARELGANHTPELMQAEYGSFEPASIFFLVFDASTMDIVGTSRGIFGTESAPPKVFDLVCSSAECIAEVAKDNAGAELTIDWIRDAHNIAANDGIFDFATLAVDLNVAKHRGSQVRPSILLYAAMVRESAFIRGDVFGAGETTAQLLQFLKRLAGMPSQRLAGLSPFPAFEGDEVFSVPFIFRWDEWIGHHEDKGRATTRVGREIYERAAGISDSDQLIF